MDSLALMNEERGKREKVHRRIFKRDTIDSDRPKKVRFWMYVGIEENRGKTVVEFPQRDR